MKRALAAGVAYFAGMFALGFALGTIRVLFIAPYTGEWAATFLELPVMLLVSWLYCGWLLRRLAVSATIGARVAMGACALTLLLAAEVLLGTALFARTVVNQINEMTSGAGLLGVIGQIAFATFPTLQLRR